MDMLDIDSDFVMEYDDLAYNQFMLCEDFDGHTDNVLEVNEIGNNENRVAKQPNTKKEQFQKINEFANDHNENNTGKSTLTELWEQMAVDLNGMGPPIRTAMQWQRVWSVFKYNTKRTELISHDNSSQASSQNRTRGRGNMRSLSKGRRDRVSANETSQIRTSNPDNNLLQETPTDRMLAQLGLLVQQNDKIIRNQDAFLTKMDKSNELLASISGKASGQVPQFQSDE